MAIYYRTFHVEIQLIYTRMYKATLNETKVSKNKSQHSTNSLLNTRAEIIYIIKNVI